MTVKRPLKKEKDEGKVSKGPLLFFYSQSSSLSLSSHFRAVIGILRATILAQSSLSMAPRGTIAPPSLDRPKDAITLRKPFPPAMLNRREAGENEFGRNRFQARSSFSFLFFPSLVSYSVLLLIPLFLFFRFLTLFFLLLLLLLFFFFFLAVSPIFRLTFVFRPSLFFSLCFPFLQ